MWVAGLLVLIALVLAVRGYMRKSEVRITQPSPVPYLVPVNYAPPVELETLPGVGRVVARRIIDYRNNVGVIDTVEKFSIASGLSLKRVMAIRSRITFHTGNGAED